METAWDRLRHSMGISISFILPMPSSGLLSSDDDGDDNLKLPTLHKTYLPSLPKRFEIF